MAKDGTILGRNMYCWSTVGRKATDMVRRSVLSPKVQWTEHLSGFFTKAKNKKVINVSYVLIGWTDGEMKSF